MNDLIETAKTVGLIAQVIGLITIAIKGGQWKGSLDSRISTLESHASETVEKLSYMDTRLDNIEKELLKVMISVQKDIEYIKKSIDEEKKNKHAPQK